jgi:hypothetical protein
MISPREILLFSIFASVPVGVAVAGAQGLGGSGTVQGTVKDPTGGIMQAVEIKIGNPVSGLARTTTTDAAGHYVFRNLPPNPYHISVEAQGFQKLERDVDVRTAVPIVVDLNLALAGAAATVDVVGHVEDLLERDPTAHTDIDRSLIARLPIESSSGLNQIVMLASPGVVADSNGFFHPIGDHAQTQFSIDNQPITDQQSRVYSNQISPDAVQAMEVISGVAPAEYGDKSSLIVHIVTRSGLDQAQPTGSVSSTYGSFKSPSFEANLGGGSHRVGNFLSVGGLRTDRFLDPPEFTALHARGDSQSLFDRADIHPTGVDMVHVNAQLSRSSFDVPNTYDQQINGQDQHQKIATMNIAPGYSRVVGSKAVLTANAWARQDRVTYTPSSDPFADTPGRVSQERRLTNFGGKGDFAYTAGGHNIKLGGALSATRLRESFTLGITDPAFNSPCVDTAGAPIGDPSLLMPVQCGGESSVNPVFNPDLHPYDLSRGGSPFAFAGAGTIEEQAAYVQDDIKIGNVSVKAGIRADHYDGLSTATLVQPRLGVSYTVPGSGTVLRSSYGRTMETPYNENLLLSSDAGASALAGTAQRLQPGKRDQVEVGIQQSLGRWAVVDVGYFSKRTDNAYDFGVLFDTPIVFPISWDHSKIDGIAGRINIVEHRGFSAFTVFGHTNAIFSPPANGGILLDQPEGDFRIDHDQKFQQTTNLQYVFNKPTGAWAAFSWRYDSGLVAGSVPDYSTALSLTADQQAAIGLFCGSTFATLDAPISSCTSANRGATRIRIPADGTADDVDNPARIAPRHLFDLGIGADNVFHGQRAKVRVRFSVVNLTNQEVLYNFLSTFTGTHFVTPRAYLFQAGVTF